MLLPLAHPALAQDAPPPESAPSPDAAPLPKEAPAAEAAPALEPAPDAEGAPVPEDAPIDELDIDSDQEEIVVVGQRDPNAVIGDIPPENTLNSRDIRAYGAASVSELLDFIAPQTASARGRDGGGRPVVLLNGKRISGFREIRDLPPEAILRLDILPEEVALKYGYRADQRVVNIILRPRFRSTATRAEAKLPTEGGRSEGEADVTRLMIGENSRTTVNLHAERATALTEAERDIDFLPGDPDERDPRDFRTLIGERRLLRAGGTINRSLFGDVSSTFDGQLEWTDGRSLLGPSDSLIGQPLGRDTETVSGHAGIALNGQKDKWRWSLTGGYDLSRTTTGTDRERELILSRDRARSTSSVGEVDVVASGPLAKLPAGDAGVTLRFGGDTRDLDSRSRRGGITTNSDLGRDELSGAVNLDLPISRRRSDFAALGNLSLNANAEVERLSDFGTLTTLGGGAVWSPVERLNLIASFTREEGAPGLQQLGDPLLTTPGTRLFDFVTGETVAVEAITGGNPGLAADSRRVFKLGGTWTPSTELDLDLRADYVRTRIDDPVSRFPGPTAAIEAAFPERFTRDADGNLTRVDLRPVNFDSSARDELRWGFNFTRPLASARPSQSAIDQFRRQRQQTGGGPAQGRPPGADGGGEGRRWSGGGGGRGGGGGFGGGRQGGRLQLSAYHTLLLRDEVRLAPGLPLLDYLDGEAAEGTTRARHRVEVDAGWFNNGLGARLSADWRSGSTVNGGRSGTLDFSPLAKVDLNLFANLGERFELVAKYPWLRGSQVRLGVDNIFDAKQKVRDTAGLVPVNYQPDLLDPQGRTIMLSIRKLFLPRFGAWRGGNRQR